MTVSETLAFDHGHNAAQTAKIAVQPNRSINRNWRNAILQVYDLHWRGAGDNRLLMTLSFVSS